MPVELPSLAQTSAPELGLSATKKSLPPKRVSWSTLELTEESSGSAPTVSWLMSRTREAVGLWPGDGYAAKSSRRKTGHKIP